MTPELWQRLKPLFEAAMKLLPESRAAFIEEACGGDTELKVNLKQLVANAEQSTLLPDGFALLPYLGDSGARHRFSPNEVLLERFRIVREIGIGGMGEVYEAEDLSLEKGRIALKTIRSDIASSPEAFHRFRQEVMLARKVTGAQVCRIHELYPLPPSGDHPATAFLTMEYLDGITLTEKLRRDGPLPLKETRRVALDICEGLRLVHAQGIIHRDLKCPNIMLCGEGNTLRAVLMDFGLAHASSAHAAAGNIPASGNHPGHTDAVALAGTPAYMAPEQFEGLPVSPATDIYALGIVLYELITGVLPFAAPTPVAAAIHRAQHPALPSSLNHSVPRHWDRIIQRCMEYDPADRYQSAEQVAKELRAGPANLRNLQTDHPWLARGACVILVAAIAWGSFYWWQTAQYYHPGAQALVPYNNALVLIREGNYAEAQRLLQETLQRDKHFVMAHARLAEALYDLDFQGSAKGELLAALHGRDRLPPLDREYLDAIDATVSGDPEAAVKDYQEIRDRLPDDQWSSGDVDLGMAYERNNQLSLALAKYSDAVKESAHNPNPAAYMHIGILEHRQHHRKEGDAAFATAQTIFSQELDSFGDRGNPEGMAELDYERGYAANGYGDSKAAEAFLFQSLSEAKNIPSVQLQIRVLCQLSSVESNSYEDTQAVAHANEAIELARDNQLDSWAAYGLVRLANAQQYVPGHLKETEDALNEALGILQKNPEPRTEALANTMLANLKINDGFPREAVGLAQAAYEYYKKNGFVEPAAKARLTLIRAERDETQYQLALAEAQDLVKSVDQLSNMELKIQTEEAEGSIYQKLEQYPAALEHYQNAQNYAEKDETPNGKSVQPYEARNCGNILWKLGGYRQSEAMLALASMKNALTTNIAENRIESALTQRQYGFALSAAQKLLVHPGDASGDTKWEVKQDELLAEAYLGMKKQAQELLSATTAPGAHKDDKEKSAKDSLVSAEAYLALGMYQQAYPAAAAAEGYFASAGLNDSDLRSALIAAAAAKALKQQADYQGFTRKIVDIQTRLKQDDGPGPFHSYISRPDLQFLMQRASVHAE